MNSQNSNIITDVTAPIPLLRITGLNVIRQGRTILSDVNFTVNRGDFIAITGPNGGGKTTLLRVILGLQAPTSGMVEHFDKSGKPVNVFKVPGYLPQKNSVDSHFPVSVRQVIASGLLADKTMSTQEKLLRIEKALKLTELENLAERPIGRLSGGQLQRTLFGRAIVAEPDVLILDEPLSYLDSHFEEHLYKIMEQLPKTSTVLLVSHQMTRIGLMANRHILVDRTVTECHRDHHYPPHEWTEA